jgi:hypothetical protein
LRTRTGNGAGGFSAVVGGAGRDGRRRCAVSLANLLWLILVVVLVLWLIGLVADVAGGAINLLLVVALVILIYNLVTRRRAA